MKSKISARTIAHILSAMLIVSGLGWSTSALAQSCAIGETPVVFNFTGGQQSINVPAGVLSATVYLSGAQGGPGRSGAGTIGGSPNSPGGAGGQGGRVRGTLAVAPGDTLTVGVGGQASQAINPGGIGQGVDGIGGGGTDLQLNGVRVGIAGGGGGGGNAGWSTTNVIAGGNGGVGGGGTGGAGATVPSGSGPFGGGGGAVGTGGAAGGGCGSFPATPGNAANGNGGDAFNFSGSFVAAGFGGGGGGGATIGAGGGGAGVGTTTCQQNWNGGGGGGAGGSSGATGLQAVTINNGVQAGHGAALICFSQPRYFISGTGSSPTGPVTLQLTGPAGTETANVAAGAAGFAFTTGLLSGENWSVAVTARPATENCTVAPSSGVVAGANVTTLVLTCTAVTVDLAPPALPAGVIAAAYNQTITASSPNGGTAPYTFTIASGTLPGGLTLSAAGVVSGMPTAPGSFNFTVQATSANGFTGTRAYTIVVATPVIVVAPAALPDGVIAAAYSQTITASSDNGGTTPYTFTIASGVLPDGLSLSPAGVVSGAPTAPGSFNFTVQATSANGFTGTRAYTIAVGTPVIVVSPDALPDGVIAAAYDQAITASSANGGTEPYTFAVVAGALPGGLTLSPAGIVSGAPTADGSFDFTVQATSANGFTGTRAYTIFIETPVIIVAPDALPDGVIAAAYSQTITASSANGGTTPYTFTIASGTLPGGLSLSPTGVVSGAPTVPGSFDFTVQATSANGFTGTRAYTIFIETPVIIVAPDALPDGVIAAAYSQTITASSANGGTTPYTFTIASGALPDGLSLSPAGVVSGAPIAPGSFDFTVQATSANGFTATRAYTIAVGTPSIVVAPNALPDGVIAAAYDQAITASSTNGGIAPYTFTIASGALPDGLSLSPAGIVSGAPTAPGSFDFTVQATSANGFTGTRAYTIAVETPVIAVAPDALPDGVIAAAYDQAITASSTNGGTTPYTFTIASGALPDGLSLSPAGVVSGAPIAPGSFDFTVQATSANGFTGTRAYTIVVEPPVIIVAPDALPDGVIASAYDQAITASSANGGTTPYTFTIAAGALPDGLSLSPAGVVSGAPTAPGSFDFTVQATSANGFTGARAYTIVIETPVISVAPDALPDGVFGVAYNQTITASSANGGTEPYTFTIASGELPGGLSLSPAGLVSGSPNALGSFDFTVQATSANGFTGTRAYTIAIDPPVITLGPEDLPDGNVFDAYGPATLLADGGTAPYAFTITAGALPAGIELNSDQISGTPSVSGTFTFTVTVTDANGFSAEREYTIVIEITLPEAQDHTLTVVAGTSGTLDLTQGAVNGPFTAAAITSPPAAEAGDATIVLEGGAQTLNFAAAGNFAGTTSLTYTLSNSDGVSEPATVTINVTGRPDPSSDPEVVGLIRAQSESAKRFADTQIGHFNRRLEQLHNEGDRRINAIGVNVGMQTDETDPDAYAAQENLLNDPALDAIRRVSPEATNNGNDPASIRTAATGASAYTSVEPVRHGAAHAATGGVMTGTANADPIVDSAPAGSPFGELAFWSGGYVNFGTNDDGGLKLDSTLVGVSAGADYRFSRELTAGFGVGFGRDATDIGDNGTESRAEAFSVAAYGSYRPVPGFFLDGLAGYSTMSFDSERYVTGTGDFASGKRDGDQIFASLTTGYEYRQDGLLISPYGRLSGSRSTLDMFTETGAGINNLTYGEQTIDTLSGTLGLRLEKAIPTSWGMLTPHARLEYTHDFEGSSRASMGYADIGTLPYALDIEAFSQDLLAIGLGFDAQFGESWNLGFAYGTVVGTDGDKQEHTVSARFNMPF